MNRLLRWLGWNKHGEEVEETADELIDSAQVSLYREDHKELLDLDKTILQDEDGLAEQRVQREAQREVQTAAVGTLKKLHVIQMGRCPVCGDHLRQHAMASICEACGWNTYETPRQGGVRVALRGRSETIEGDRCYSVKGGTLLVVKNDAVIARIAADAYDYVLYPWAEVELLERNRQALARMNLLCGWCNKGVDPNIPGFHLVHVAFGATQERYCFCSDDCFEAFRRTYPARVHRDCYNRNCDECHLCTKRYREEADGIQTLAKDYLKLRKPDKEEARHG